MADALNRDLSIPPPAFGVGQVLRLQGGGFGPRSPLTLAPGVDQRYPTSLDGLTGQVAGVDAPILSAAPGEVVFAIPFSTPAGNAVPVVVHDQGAPPRRRTLQIPVHAGTSEAFPIPVQVAEPWLLRESETVFNSDGTPNGTFNPCHWGSTLTLYLTGAGPYSPPLADGQVANDLSHRLQLPVSFSLATITQTQIPATVLYAGAAPGQIGVAQINIQLPPTGPEPSAGELVTLIQPQLQIGSASADVPLISVR